MVTTTSSARDEEEVEGAGEDGVALGDYPIDSLLIRNDSRTVFETMRKIKNKTYIMNPDFQRDFIWDEARQSKLIESVLMRIPLPVFYMAENDEGKVTVVDGVQRLFTFHRFLNDELKLKLPDRKDLNRKKFSDLMPRLQNRVEDCNLTFYVLDSKVPDRARLDIFDRVNGGVPLTRQQMRNCLYMGQATEFLKKQVQNKDFKLATGGSLDSMRMRDREFINRFCAFQLMDDINQYRGDMDDLLAECLRKMNSMDSEDLSRLSKELRRGLHNNHILFKEQAFRRHERGQQKRGVINASLWDVMSTGLSHYDQSVVSDHADDMRDAFYDLLDNESFTKAITYGTSDAKPVKCRFSMAREMFEEVLGAYSS